MLRVSYDMRLGTSESLKWFHNTVRHGWTYIFFCGWDDIHEKSFSHEKGEVDLSLKKWHVLC